LEHRGGQAVSARHVAVVYTIGVDRADILVAGRTTSPRPEKARARHRHIEFEWQADAVTLLDIAFAVSEPVEHKTTGNGAERVGNQGPVGGLTVADLEELGRGHGGIGIGSARLATGVSRTADCQQQPNH